MDKWDSEENRESNREELNRKVGKFMLISAVIGLAYYLAIYY